ncbi:hypothetical protein PHK61_07105 [Actinomycetospora lutea]|uniref:DUF3592 domain-containing protein n=1 Tax=Actinomycetospora lutea TaxID=663604 RepID=UPI0023667FA8|nr:DUF3592 domain-containing protein [Actinomycetospora lutea]MDD7938183.1 hypothetical protein [Actinomycetospora lutea]
MTWLRALVRRARARVAPFLADALELIRPAGRRAPEIVVVVGVVVSVLLALVLVAAARNDAHIDAARGDAVAEVLEGGSRPHVYVRFTTVEGAVLTPEKGVFYPRGLEPGQLVEVEYDRTDPELVRVGGRTWTEGLVPVLLGLLVLWAVVGPSAWALARARRRRREAAASAARWRSDRAATRTDEHEDGEPEMAGAVPR